MRKIDAGTQIISTVAGSETRGFCGDGGDATQACMDQPFGLALDIQGNLYIADSNNSRVRKVDADTGIITTVAGNGSLDFLWRWGGSHQRLF